MRKAVIFDLDGTLLFTLGDIAGAVNRVLKQYRLPGFPVEAYKAMVGFGLKDLTRQAVKQQDPDADETVLEKVYQRVLEEYTRFPVEETVPYPGIPEMLDTLAAMDIPVSILSNKEDSLVQIITKKCFPEREFIVVQGRRREVPAKPDPAAVYAICTAMEVDRAGTVFVGDSGSDMQTARNAGVPGIGVSWGYRDVGHLKKEGADYIAFLPDDIVHFIMREES